MSSPSAEELVGDFLYNKVHGNPLPHNASVNECDLYEEEPWEVWKKYGGLELERNGDDNKGFLYLFTKLKKQSMNGKRFLRRVGCNGGVWEGEAGPKEIVTQFCVGFSKRFRYENPGSDQHGRWIMIEYSLDDYNGEVNDYVLCSVKKNNNTTRGRKRRVCQQIESSKQELQPLKKQKGEEDPIITSEISPSTPQLCCSANSLDYSSDRASELLQNREPLTFITYPSTPSVEVQQLCSNGGPTTDESDYNDWEIVLTEELLQNQPVSIDFKIITSGISPSTPQPCDKAPKLVQELMLQNQPTVKAETPKLVQELMVRNQPTVKAETPELVQELLLQNQPTVKADIPTLVHELMLPNQPTVKADIPKLVQELMLPNQPTVKADIPKLVQELMLSNQPTVKADIPKLVHELMLQNQPTVKADIPKLVQELMLQNQPNVKAETPKLVQELMLENQPTIKAEKLCSSAAADEYDGPLDYYNDWTIKFAKELLQYNSSSTLEYCEIELLPNENCNNLMGWQSLS